MSDKRALYLIDGSSQMYRAYHAFRGRGLSNQEGQTTHAVYVFVTMLRKLINEHHPEYMAASFDLAGRTFRDELVADYKATRAAMPDDLAEQIAWVHEACEALGVGIAGRILQGGKAVEELGDELTFGGARSFILGVALFLTLVAFALWPLRGGPLLGITSEALGIPQWWYTAGLALGGAAVLLRLLQAARRLWASGGTGWT